MTGTGPTTRELGEDSRIVAAFRTSEGVRDARECLYGKYRGWVEDGDKVVDYSFKFTLPRAYRARTAAQQFIGSYNMDLLVRGGRIHFKAINRTGVDSLLYGTARDEAGNETEIGWEGGPMGNKYQTLRWSEPVVQRESERIGPIIEDYCEK